MASTINEPYLLNLLRNQLEFYFSPQNLSRDVYLRNLLNMYGGTAVPLSIIANFPKVRELCSGQIELQLLLRAVEGSKVVSVTSDAMWISPLLPIPPLTADSSKRPNSAPLGMVGTGPSVGVAGGGVYSAHQPHVQVHGQGLVPIPTMRVGGDSAVRNPSANSSLNSQGSSGGVDNDGTSSVNTNTTGSKGKTAARSTIILRDIPRDWPPSKIIKAFTFDNVTPKAARPDVGNTWYITFHSENDAFGAVLKTKDDQIEGRPIRARIKSEAIPPAGSDSTRPLADPSKPPPPIHSSHSSSDVSQQLPQAPVPQHASSTQSIANPNNAPLPQTATHPNAPNVAPITHAPQISIPPGAVPASTYAAYHLPYGASAGGTTAYHHPGAYPGAYPQHVPIPYVYGYPYVQPGMNSRGYFPRSSSMGATGGGGGGGNSARNSNSDGEIAGGRRHIAGGKGGEGPSGGASKRKGKMKKGQGGGSMQNYHNHDHSGNGNNAPYGQQHHRWKYGPRGDGGGGNVNETGDSYGKRSDGNRNYHHNSSGNRSKHDSNHNNNNSSSGSNSSNNNNSNWNNNTMPRNNNRSQNDNIATTMDGRIISGGDYYNNIGNSGGQLGNSKAGGGTRKKKNKRRDAEMNDRQKEYDRKQEIFDASSFPALSPIENGSSNTATTTSNSGGGVGGSSTLQTTSEDVRNQISGYADALRQSNKPSRLVLNTTAMADHRPSSVSSIQSESAIKGTVVPSINEVSASSNNAETSNTSTSTNNATEALSNLKVSSSSTNSQTPQQSAGEKCKQPHTTKTITTTTIAVGALTGTPTTTTVTKTGVPPDSVSSGLQNTNHASLSTTTDTTITAAKNNNTNNTANTIRQSGDEPTPREASHKNNLQSSSAESKATAKVKELAEVGGVEAKSKAIQSTKAGKAEASSSPPSAWGNKRSYIDVARKQS